MRSRVPRARKVVGGNRIAIGLMAAIAALLVIAIVVLLQNGLFSTQPKSPEERNLVLIRAELKKNPNNALLLLDLAENEYAVGKHGDAVGHAARAAELATSTPLVNLRYAQLLMLTKDYKGAEKHLDMELALPGTDTDTSARFILAQVYREQGRLDEAIALMQTALETEYQAADYRKVLADMLVTKGNTKAAIEQYKLVLTYLPDDQQSIDALKKLGVTDIPTSTVAPH